MEPPRPQAVALPLSAGAGHHRYPGFSGGLRGRGSTLSARVPSSTRISIAGSTSTITSSPASRSPASGVAILAGFAVCVFAAMIRAPFFRAIVGSAYPLAPRRVGGGGKLFLFYLLLYLVGWVAPCPALAEGMSAGSWSCCRDITPHRLRRLRHRVRDAGVRTPSGAASSLLARRWVSVLLIFIVLNCCTPVSTCSQPLLSTTPAGSSSCCP